MKIIESATYRRFKESQQVIDWDNPERETADVGEFFGDEQAGLPVIKEEDIGKILEDDLELGQEAVPEGAPVVEELPETRPEERPVFENKHDAIDWAETNNEVLRINYTTKHGTNMERDVEPHGKFYARTTHRTILVTFDRTVNAIRAFIIKNINSLDFTGERFQKKFIVSTR